MMEDFFRHVRAAAARLKEFDSSKIVRVVSHLDADGICACSILIKALSNENRKYSISIQPQLDRRVILDLAQEPYELFVFTDFGSGQLDIVGELMQNKIVFVLDHHTPKYVKTDSIVHVNPHLFGIDGGIEISGAGVVYLFAQALSEKNMDLAYLAIIGAIGDNQEKGAFRGLNAMILKTAESTEKIRVEQGLRLFGLETRPLYKLLEYSFHPFIPEVSGSESGAVSFLQSLGINPKKGSGWRLLSDLTEVERSRLIEGIILRRLGDKRDIIGPIYKLPAEKEALFRDAREFSTVLNACGRLNRASVGLGVCLGDEKARRDARLVLADYRKEIVQAIRWYEEGVNRGHVLKGERYIIINGGREILPTMAGTLASILSRSNDVAPGTFILSMARTENSTIKVSLRRAGKSDGTDLREVIGSIVAKIGGESGGHMNAAGAIIPEASEERFIEASKDYFSSI